MENYDVVHHKHLPCSLSGPLELASGNTSRSTAICKREKSIPWKCQVGKKYEAEIESEDVEKKEEAVWLGSLLEVRVLHQV